MTNVSVCTAVCFVPALWFFKNKEKNSEKSHAESREYNDFCIFLKYYDKWVPQKCLKHTALRFIILDMTATTHPNP